MTFIVTSHKIGDIRKTNYHQYSNTAYTQARKEWERTTEEERKCHAVVQIWTATTDLNGISYPRDLIWENGVGL